MTMMTGGGQGTMPAAERERCGFGLCRREDGLRWVETAIGPMLTCQLHAAPAASWPLG